MAVTRVRRPYHPLLGQHVEHDDRSLAYGAMGLPWSQIKSVEWTRRIPILDQSNLHRQGITLPNGEDGLGSCTGQEDTGWLGTDNKWRRGLTEITLPAVKHPTPDVLFYNYTAGAAVPLDERFAIQTYQWATIFDGFGGDWVKPGWQDTGSSGLATTKVDQKQYKQVKSYRHAFSLRQVCTLLQDGPVGFGTVYLESMFDPDSNGVIPVVPSSGVAGGHQYLVRKLDVENRRFGMDNSWNIRWGLDGSAWIRWDDWPYLASQQGDFISRVPVLV